MKVKAKIVLKCCSIHSKEIKLCEYVHDQLCDSDFEYCDGYVESGETCANLSTKTLYIDREYKEVETVIKDTEDIVVLKLGKKKYINDINKEIEYLYIDDKAIVKDYLIIQEDEEAE